MRRTGLPVWRRLSWRLGGSALVLTAMVVLVSGLLQYRDQERWVRQSLGGLLLNIARTGALLVDGDLHQQVLAAGRKDSPEYETLLRQLRGIQAVNGLGDAVYTLFGIDGANARFGVVSNGIAPLGLEYRLAPEIQPVLARVLAEGQAGYTDIYRSSSGTWITAFAPIRNRAGGTVAALDVDFRADVYLEQLAAIRRRLYLHSAVAALLGLAGAVVIARRITRPVTALSTLARAVVEGDPAPRVRVRARDEIGLLGNVLHLMIERVRVSHQGLVEVLVRALEAREGTPGALARLSSAAVELGDRLALTPAQREALALGALLHDIGEIRTPEAILRTPGPLAAAERQRVQEHPAAGVTIVEAVPLLTPAVEVVGAHHERWDGNGYPLGLKTDDIPLVARIFAVVDALDAMIHARPHRPARSMTEALAELDAGAGTQFDPRVVAAALAIPMERWEYLLGGRREGAGGPSPTEREERA